jgi:hypothetical protein
VLWFQLFEPRSGIGLLNHPVGGIGVEPTRDLLFLASLRLPPCKFGLLIPSQIIPTFPTTYLQYGLSFHGLPSYSLQYAKHRWFSEITLSTHYPTLGLICVLSLCHPSPPSSSSRRSYSQPFSSSFYRKTVASVHGSLLSTLLDFCSRLSAGGGGLDIYLSRRSSGRRYGHSRWHHS